MDASPRSNTHNPYFQAAYGLAVANCRPLRFEDQKVLSVERFDRRLAPAYEMRDVLRRHWLVVGNRYGIVSPEGLDAEAIIDDLVARTPDVVNTVSKQLPTDFPPALADSILTGLLAAASRLAG